MSLGTWFKDYLYVPLGGNRVSKTKWFRNIFIVWFLTGFWHGVNWNFIIWGLYFGIILVIEKVFLKKFLEKIPALWSHIYVILMVVISFVIFNIETTSDIIIYLRGMFGLLEIPLWNVESIYYLKSYGITMIVAMIGATPLMKNKIIAMTFVILLGLLLVINILIPKKELSYSERRKLALFPKFTIEKVLNGEFTKEFEDYTLDQFAFRDQFRSLKAFFDLKVLNKKDNNEIYVMDDHVFKMEYPLDSNSIDKISLKLNKIYDLYLQDMNVFYTIIPDKNYFRQEENTHLIMDYDKLEEMMIESIKNMKYIDIMDALELEDYYKTDPHWKQERLDKVLKILGEQMNFKKDLTKSVYTKKTYAPFYGAYYGQSALNMKPDLLTYQTNPRIENAIVYNSENPSGKDAFSSIYDEEKLGKMDSYDVFLSGATPLLTVEDPDNLTGKELIIFRDSFASSLAPLLLEEYSKITLVDLRYMRLEDLGNFVDFKDQDVLFLYSTLVVNNSNVLK